MKKYILILIVGVLLGGGVVYANGGFKTMTVFHGKNGQYEKVIDQDENVICYSIINSTFSSSMGAGVSISCIRGVKNNY